MKKKIVKKAVKKVKKDIKVKKSITKTGSHTHPGRPAKKPATKTVQKKGALTTKVQDADYWLNRPLDDKQRDWNYKESDWIWDYVASASHPHRDIIVEELNKLGSLGGILEVGCNAGPNLIRLQAAFPETQLAGIDIVPEAIERAMTNMSKPIFKVGNVLSIPFEDKSFDCVLADAVLMYLQPKEINRALNEINRIVKRYVVLVERVSEKEKNNGFIWSRNYPKLLEDLGFSVQTRKLEEKDWPESEGWQKEGMIVVASRPQS